MRRHWLIISLTCGFFLTLIGAMLSASAAPSTAQADPFIIVEHHWLSGNDFIPLRQDPALAETPAEFEYLANVFMPLRRVNPENPSESLPGVLDIYSVSDDGLVYNFNVNTDIQWVSYDAVSGVVVTNRSVSGFDVFYSLVRVCDSPNNSALAVDIVGPTIDGCELGIAGRNPARVLDIQPRSNSIQITLSEPNSGFLQMLTLPTLTPIPTESVDANDVAWGPGTVFWTSGPFIPTEFGWLRNPTLPTDVSGFSNIDLVLLSENRATPPDPIAIDRPSTGMIWLDIDLQSVPLNNVHVRRALSAAIDRDAIFTDGFVPMTHIAPSPLFGGLIDDEIGVGFDLNYAREELAFAGYPNCTGMPSIRYAGVPAEIIDAWLALGCSSDQFIEWTPSVSAAPELFYTAFDSAAYNDVDYYLQLLRCDDNNPLQRACTVADILIERGRATNLQFRRSNGIPAIMDTFFGPSGEMPVIPLARRLDTITVPSWLEGPFNTNGVSTGVRYDNYFAAPETAPDTIYGDGSAIYTGTVQGRRFGNATPLVVRDPTPVLPPFDRDAPTCQLQALYRVNVRTSPYGGPVIRQLEFGEIVNGIALYSYPNTFRYFWQIEGGGWVRDNLVAESQPCFDLPFNQ